MERNEEARAEFREIVDSYPQYKLYYIDECGLDEYLHREYGYSVRGTPVMGEARGKKYERTNVVAAKCCDRIVAPMIYDGTTDCVIFEYWFETQLLKYTPKYSVFIMDNATFHRKSRLPLLAEKFGCNVIFLPLHIFLLKHHRRGLIHTPWRATCR